MAQPLTTQQVYKIIPTSKRLPNALLKDILVSIEYYDLRSARTKSPRKSKEYMDIALYLDTIIAQYPYALPDYTNPNQPNQ